MNNLKVAAMVRGHQGKIRMYALMRQFPQDRAPNTLAVFAEKDEVMELLLTCPSADFFDPSVETSAIDGDILCLYAATGRIEDDPPQAQFGELHEWLDAEYARPGRRVSWPEMETKGRELGLAIDLRQWWEHVVKYRDPPR
jgi:hypothetical protein